MPWRAGCTGRIALLVIAKLATGLVHEPLEEVIRLVPFHKATGMMIPALSVVRVLWRLGWTPPPYPATLTGTETSRPVPCIWRSMR